MVTTHALFALAKIVAIRASSQRFRSMSTVCARTPRDVGTEPELRTPGAAAQTRMVSGIRLDPNRSIRCFKGIVYVDISEFESYMPSHAVASLRARQASWIELRFKSPLGPWSERASSSRAAAQPKSARPIDFCHDFQPIVSPGAAGARDCQCFRHASSSGLERQRCR